VKLATIDVGGDERVAAVLADGSSVLDLAAAAETATGQRPAWAASMLALIEGGDSALEEARELMADPPPGAVLAAGQYTLLAPLPRPPRMRDCSMIIDHLQPASENMARMRASDPEQVERDIAAGRFKLAEVFFERIVYYTSDPLTVSATGEEIVWPAYSKVADFELEWAVVIGKRGMHVAADDAASHIFGYTIFNDWSARDEQGIMMSSGIGPGSGKDFDKSNTIGPWIVTADEIDDPYDLRMTARVNGEVWGDSSSSTMRHKFEDAVVEFSTGRTIYPGELWGSGTVPGGCALEHGRRLSDGDVVELEVERIGTLRNRVRIPHA
jgi:2-keto-4-pentenoate hydratase/2-oxohepta-3-ene-1,7-dioic acid hydratase in catechol pathway